MGDFIKQLFGALDKFTDILNLGRLVFYTAAGLAPVLAAAMTVRTLAAAGQFYWVQFKGDLLTCIGSIWVWAAALIVGFLVSNVGYAQVIASLKTNPDDNEIDTDGFTYQYPVLRAGRLKRGSSDPDFDFAAWLISEYYRYLEIAVYVPYGVLLAFPLLALHAFARILLEAQHPSRLDGCFAAFALWTIVALLGWTTFWSDYWLPKVAAPIKGVFVTANASIIAGVRDYASSPPAPATKPAEPKPATPEKS